MTILYNPDWKKQGNTWSLTNTQLLGIIQSQVTRDYKWEVYGIEGGPVLHSGISPDLVAAFNQVEKLLGYFYFIEMEYEMEKGCRCGSCTEATGKWVVYNRDDTVNEKFDSESEAIVWIMEKYGEGK
jgi:hypothetical protein